MATDIGICNMALDDLGANVVTAIDGTDTSKAGKLCERNYARLRNEVLSEHPWSFATAQYESDTDLEDALYQKTITNIVEDSATQITVTTSAAHGWTTNKSIEFNSIVGTTELNTMQLRVNTVPTTTTATFIVETADLTAYVSGGTAQVAPLFGFNYSFALPSDFLQDERKENKHFIYEIDDGFIHTDVQDLYFNYIRQVTDTTKFTPAFIKALVARIRKAFARPITGNSGIVTEMNELYEIELARARKSDANRGVKHGQDNTKWINSRKGWNSNSNPQILR